LGNAQLVVGVIGFDTHRVPLRRFRCDERLTQSNLATLQLGNAGDRDWDKLVSVTKRILGYHHAQVELTE
jgi:hypothetical protein